MANPTYFTVVADFKSVVVDLDTDVDPDPQLGPVTAKCTFTPVLNNGDVILATNASPRPTVFVPAPIVARIDTDGKLKLRVAPDGDRDNFANLAAFPATGNTAKVYFAIDTQTFYRWLPGSSQYVEDYSYAQVRLLADTALLELDSPLYYKVTFSDVVYNGGPGYINSFTFQAPTSDIELNLVDVARVPGQPASGITKIAPGAVRAENGNLIFSFGGVDLDEPVPYTDVDVTLDAADISDGTPTGRALITAASAAAARAAIGATATGSSVFTAADVAAARTTLGATTTGSSVFTAANAAEARTTLGIAKVVAVSNYIASTATFQAAIAAAITSAGANGVVDFEGVSYVTTGTVTVSTAGVTLQNGGIRPTGPFMALYVTAADVTVRDMKFSRSQSYNFDDDAYQQCCVSVNAQRFSSYNCDYLSTHLACVYFVNGSCDGAIISGGEMTGTAATQSACGVLAAAGSTGHRNITITGVYVHDTTDGILLFDSSDCLVSHNRVESLRRLPTVTLTGWTLVSGTIWRQRTASGTPGVDGPTSDRADGPSVSFKINGTQSAVQSYESTTPSLNRASISGGFVYINLATNPNSATITSDIVSAYAYMIYSFGSSGALCSRNRVINNTADDIDGFGIYMQLGDGDTAKGNIVAGNILTNVCLEGSQTANLSFGGLTISNGADTLVSGNRLNGVGSAGKVVPGVYVNWSGTSGSPSGRIVDTIVSGSFTVGFDIRSSNWSLQGCHSYDNANAGFRVYTTLASVVIDNVTLTDCHAYDNTTEGFSIDGGVAGIGYVSANIIGGTSIGNTRRGVILNSRADGSTVKNCSVIGMKVTDNDTGGLNFQVQLSNAVSAITVTGCQIESSAGTGIFFAALATDLTLTNNHFSIPTPETSPLPVPVRVGGAKNSAAQWRGAGSPEGVVTAPVGSKFQRTDGGAGTALYIKESGTGNTGWVAAVTPTATQTITNKNLTSGTNTFPTFNQDTTGSAATLTTARNIDGQSFNGSANITVIAPGTNAATGKTTPADADAIPLVDSAASNVLKKLTIGNLKTAVRTPTDVQVFTSSGTWTKPANAVSVHVRCIASGGGGGAGARGPSGTALSGGGGGGGGGMCEMITPASDLTSTVTVTVGAGGAGATGQTANGTVGANGTAGFRSSFGAYLFAFGGGGGTGGGLASAGTAGLRGQGQFAGSAGGAGSATGAAGAIGTSTQSAAGGAAGGGITTAPAATAGGVGGFSETAQLSGGTAGSASDGGGGNSGGAKTPASGGGGGGASITGAGFNGGVGGTYGGGGGGGGASLNGNTSGAGGTGGPGICVVTTYF